MMTGSGCMSVFWCNPIVLTTLVSSAGVCVWVVLRRFPGLPLTSKRGSAKLCQGSWLYFARFRDPCWLWFVPIVVMGFECSG